MPTYKVKAAQIEARRLFADKVEDIAHWCGGGIVEETDALDATKKFVGINVPTLYGVVRASEGDYVTKNERGEFDASKPAVFQMTYEEV